MRIFPDLERAVDQYCGELRNKHKKQRRNIIQDGRLKTIWDLPCVASACRYSNCTIHKSVSKPVNINTYRQTPELESALLGCAGPHGRIGDPTTLSNCSYQVGRCAEPHAAKECILKRPQTRLAEIDFSQARCIRTGEVKIACAICKHVFPNLR